MAVPPMGCEGTHGDGVSTRSEAIDDVLEIAVSRRPDSLTKLRAIREHSADDAVQDYIDAIIDRWDESKMTYISPRPIQTVQECLQLTAEDRFTVRTATSIAFNVEVDERGNPSAVELFGGTKDPELARRMKESIAKQRFIPANDNEGVKRGKITVVCRVEVR
jgi:hypothetical protein